MRANTTAKALLEFLDQAAEKGWLNKNTAAGYRAACQRILEIEDGWEDVDVAALDVDDIFQRFLTLKGNDYSPGSLQTYKSRFRTALETFLERAKDPSAWKAPATIRRRQGESKAQQTDRKARTQEGAAQRRPTEPSAKDGMISYPFPLRQDIDAQLVLPRDLTPEEARRLVAFVNALAIEDAKAEGG